MATDVEAMLKQRRFNETETGNVRNRQRNGRQELFQYPVKCNWKSKKKQLVLNHNMSRGSVPKILKREKYHPNKIHLLLELSEDDFHHRIEFCEIIADRLDQEGNFINQWLFSDESTFYFNGHVEHHNCGYWSNTNPYWMEEVHTQYSQKINVWYIIGQISNFCNKVLFLGSLQMSSTALLEWNFS